MEELAAVAFKIIAAVGDAKSSYVEAIQEAKSGNFETARNKIEEGVKSFQEGHHAHADLIQKEATGELDAVSLLLMHAEDQLMTTETFKLVAQEFIEVYERLEGKNA